MINVLLKGGLGNQLFQYAFGMSAANEYGTDLTLYDGLVRNSGHDYVLKSFRIAANFQKSFHLPYLQSERRIAQKINRNLPWVNVERNLLYDPVLITKSRHRLNIGYFQSADYFQKYRMQLTSNLILEACHASKTRTAVQTINRDEVPVSVHIRRGDFLSDPGASKVHGFIGEMYYKKATELLFSRLSLVGKTPLFLIFSDDPKWAADFFRQLSHKFRLVSSDKFDAAQELYLMSNCSHNIIANSSFSWWGSYLNVNSKKITVAPKRWYADNRAHSIYMDGWDLL